MIARQTTTTAIATIIVTPTVTTIREGTTTIISKIADKKQPRLMSLHQLTTRGMLETPLTATSADYTTMANALLSVRGANRTAIRL